MSLNSGRDGDHTLTAVVISHNRNDPSPDADTIWFSCSSDHARSYNPSWVRYLPIHVSRASGERTRYSRSVDPQCARVHPTAGRRRMALRDDMQPPVPYKPIIRRRSKRKQFWLERRKRNRVVGK